MGASPTFFNDLYTANITLHPFLKPLPITKSLLISKTPSWCPDVHFHSHHFTKHQGQVVLLHV